MNRFISSYINPFLGLYRNTGNTTVSELTVPVQPFVADQVQQIVTTSSEWNLFNTNQIKIVNGLFGSLEALNISLTSLRCR